MQRYLYVLYCCKMRHSVFLVLFSQGRGFYIVTNGLSAYHTWAHIHYILSEGNFKVGLTDLSEKIGVLSVQGQKRCVCVCVCVCVLCVCARACVCFFPPTLSVTCPTPQYFPTLSVACPSPQYFPTLSVACPAPQYFPTLSVACPTPQYFPTLSVACPTPQYFPTLSHKQQFLKKVIEYKMNVFIFSTTFFLKLFSF